MQLCLYQFQYSISCLAEIMIACVRLSWACGLCLLSPVSLAYPINIHQRFTAGANCSLWSLVQTKTCLFATLLICYIRSQIITRQLLKSRRKTMWHDQLSGWLCWLANFDFYALQVFWMLNFGEKSANKPPSKITKLKSKPVSHCPNTLLLEFCWPHVVNLWETLKMTISLIILLF